MWPRDPRTQKLEHLGVELLTGNITEYEDVDLVVRGVDAIYHLAAAFQGGGPFTEREYFDINVNGTFNMLEAVRESADSVQHFVYAGTDAVYAQYVPGGVSTSISEDTPKAPAGHYALTKSLGEDLCLGYHRSHGIPVTVVRFANVFGAGEILDFPQFYLRSIADRPEASLLDTRHEKLMAMSDEFGRPYKKHIADVRDIVGGCAAVLGRNTCLGQVIQLAAPGPFSWNEVVPYLSEQLDLPYESVILGGIPTYYEFDLTRCRNLLGYEPEFGIERMIDDAVRFRKGEDIGLL